MRTELLQANRQVRAFSPVIGVGTSSPGAANVLNEDVIAEHRTLQKFRTRKIGHVRAPSVTAEDRVQNAASAKDTKATPPPTHPDPLLTLPGATSDHWLLGANTRCMLGWCRLAIARAYAFGLYADQAALDRAIRAAQQAVAAGSTSGPGSLALSALLDSKEEGGGSGGRGVGELSLVLVMNRDIPGDHLAHGFRNSALARLSARAKEREQKASYPPVDRRDALSTGKVAGGISPHTPSPGVAMNAVTGGGSSNALAGGSGSSGSGDGDAVAQLSAFVQAFNGWTFRSGEEITFVWGEQGAMLTAFHGKLVPEATITNPAVIRALWDVYCGQNPVSARAKGSFEANLAALVQYPGPVLGAGRTSVPPGDAIVKAVLAEHASRTK